MVTNDLAARWFDKLLIVGALAVMINGVIGWFSGGLPTLRPFTITVMLTSAVLIAVVMRTDDLAAPRIIASVVMAVSLAVIISPVIRDSAREIITIWCLIMIAAFAATLRVRFLDDLPLIAVLIIAGEALILAVRIPGLGVPNQQIVVGFLAFLAVAFPLGVIRERLYGRRLLAGIRSIPMARIIVGLLAYTFAVIAALNLLVAFPGNYWASAGLVAIVVLIGLILWQTTQLDSYRRLTGALLQAEMATPWPEGQAEAIMEQLVRDHVRVDSVTVQGAPGESGAISAEVADDKYLVARRRAGDQGFSREDADVVGGIAALGRATYIQATQRRHLELLANTDDLTGLWEYKYWLTVLSDTCSNRIPGESIAVIFFDLDYFKNINTNFGHIRADIALAALGKRLNNIPHWRFARFGGDEFVGFLASLDAKDQLETECAHIQQVASEPVLADGREIVLGVTIGRTISFDKDDNPRRMVAIAERDGRERKAARPTPDEGPSDTEMMQALLDGGLSVMYQPIVSLKTGEVHGYEALLRGNIPGKGAISPPDIVVAARNLGLLDTLTQRVAQTAVPAIEEVCRLTGRRLSVSINIETDQLTWDSEALEWLAHRAADSPARIVAEITERGETDWTAEQDELVTELNARGVHFALDDYGAGQSRLRAVARRRWYAVKMDRDFLTTDQTGLTMLRHNVAAMHELGQVVVLEGLEDADQLALAKSLGIDYGQGFLLGRPMTIENLLAHLPD